MLKRGASPILAVRNTGVTAIHRFALWGTDPEILGILLEKARSETDSDVINIRDANNETPLHYLLGRPKVPMPLLERFLALGADPSIDDSSSARKSANFD